MIDITPKISDTQSLKDLSKILALPMVAVAYVFQTGAVISWNSHIWLGIPPELAPEIQLRRLILVFVLKALWSGGIASCAYSVLAIIHLRSNEWLLQQF